MLITVINDAGDLVDDNDLLHAVRAVNRQIDHDFAPYWNLAGELRLGGRPGATDPELGMDIHGDAVIYIQGVDKRAGHHAGVSGYHDKTGNGLPVAFVYVGPGLEWQQTLSHEALELVADPLINLYAHGPHPDPKENGRMVFHAYEVCDAVEGEFYIVDGNKVSNFLLPLYFTAEGHTKGRIVFQIRKGLKPLRSFGLNPEGYIPYYDPLTRKQQQYHLRFDPKTHDLVGYYRTESLMAHYSPRYLEECAGCKRGRRRRKAVRTSKEKPTS